MAKPSKKNSENEKAEEGKSLYEVLEISPNATQAEVKKSYYRLALKLHPDKNPGNEEAKEKFQMLQKVYGILGDPDKRKAYDECGILEDDDLASGGFEDLYEYFRAIYKQVSIEDIEAAEMAYRGSEEETKDLKDLYLRFKGDMNKVFNWLMCSQPDLDSHRFMEILNAGISCGELRSFKKFRTWAEDVSQKPAPKNPLKKRRVSKKIAESEKDLVALISKRNNERNLAFFDSLEEKYSKKKTGVKKVVEPSEEEFLAAREKISKRQKRK